MSFMFPDFYIPAECLRSYALQVPELDYWWYVCQSEDELQSCGEGVWTLTVEDKLEIFMDVRPFAKSEISVKTKDGTIVVEAAHGERKVPRGTISQSCRMTYPLPDDHDAQDVISRVISNGDILHITTRKWRNEDDGSVNVPITSSGSIRVENE